MPNNYPYEYVLCEDMDVTTNEPAQQQNLQYFSLLFYITEAVGALLILLVAIWVFNMRGGVAWSSSPALEFNWHPLLMTIGLVFLYANGMLIYRSQRTVRKRRLKLIHAGIMIFTVLLTLIALKASFDSHNLAVPPIPNLYTLHSWLGLAVVILFCCQWLIGLLSFLYPVIPPQLRADILPLHVYFGTVGFVGTIATCLIGLTEKAIWATNYKDLPSESVLINIIGLTFIVFGVLTIYLVSQERYKRLPQPEDDVLLVERNK